MSAPALAPAPAPAPAHAPAHAPVAENFVEMPEAADFERALMNSPDIDTFFKAKAANAAEEATRRAIPVAEFADGPLRDLPAFGEDDKFTPY